MKLQQIRTFVAVYQEGSFTTAARREHATQSGLSMQIKELEQTLGVKLFARSPTGVRPTKAGDRFYRRAQSILRELDEAQAELNAAQTQMSGRVAVGVMPTFSRAALPPALDEFTRTHPLVELRVVEAYSATLIDAVKTGELDCAVVPPPPRSAGVAAKFIGRDRELFVTAWSGKRRHLSPISLADGGPLHLILPSKPNARRERIDTYLASVGANVTATVEMDAMMGTLDLIARSHWVAILPHTLCQPDIDAKVRKLHPLANPSLTVDYVLITSNSRPLPPAAKAFAALLTANIERLCDQGERTFA